MDITVVIPTYNRYKFLQRALESVFAQTYQPAEVIVVDDGSSDATAEITKKFKGIRYFYQKNLGVASARNYGVAQAKHSWIAFLDSDDCWDIHKLEYQIALHVKHKDIQMSYTDEVWIRHDKRVNIPKKFKKIGKDVFRENLSYCNIAPSSVMLHVDIFKKYGGFDTTFEVCEDYDLWLKIAAHNEVVYLDEKLIKKFAGHNDQLSYKYWGMDRWRVRTLEYLYEHLTCNDKKELVRQELIVKYDLLMQGAKKYDKIHDFKFYKGRLEYFKYRD